MVPITSYNCIVNGVYKPSYNWGAPHCSYKPISHDSAGPPIPPDRQDPDPEPAADTGSAPAAQEAPEPVPAFPMPFEMNAEMLPEMEGHHDHQWIGVMENLQENPLFNGKIYGFL